MGSYTGPRFLVADMPTGRVQIISCRRCGAALLVDEADDFDVKELHDRWHEGAEA